MEFGSKIAIQMKTLLATLESEVQFLEFLMSKYR